jgi:hypothetical protein
MGHTSIVFQSCVIGSKLQSFIEQRWSATCSPGAGRRVEISSSAESLVWNRIVSACMERMATGDAFHTEPGALEHAIALDRFRAVRTAGWKVTTRGRQGWRDRSLVETNEQKRQGFHVSGVSSVEILSVRPEPPSQFFARIRCPARDLRDAGYGQLTEQMRPLDQRAKRSRHLNEGR